MIGNLRIDRQAPIEVAGLACVDNFFTPPEKIPTKGGLEINEYLGSAPGGAVSNVGVALTRLGFWEVHLYGMVGSDLFGAYLQDFLSHNATTVNLRKAPDGATTAVSNVTCYTDGDRRFVHSPMASRQFGLRREDYPGSSKTHLHIGYPPLLPAITSGTGLGILTNTLAGHIGAGGTTSMDMAIAPPSYPGASDTDWPHFFRTVGSYVTIFTPSIEELILELDPTTWATYSRIAAKKDLAFEDVFPFEALPSFADQLVEYGFQAMAVKLGRHGVYVRMSLPDLKMSSGEMNPTWNCVEMIMGSYNLDGKIIGTTGSGDSMIAGLIAAAVSGWDLFPALRFSQAVAAFSTAAKDATSGIKSADEIIGWMNSPEAQVVAPRCPAGWRVDNECQAAFGPNHED